MKDNENDEITQAMHDLTDKNGNDPCKSDVEVLRKALKAYGVRNLEGIFFHSNDATRK